MHPRLSLIAGFAVSSAVMVPAEAYGKTVGLFCEIIEGGVCVSDGRCEQSRQLLDSTRFLGDIPASYGSEAGLIQKCRSAVKCDAPLDVEFTGEGAERLRVSAPDETWELDRRSGTLVGTRLTASSSGGHVEYTFGRCRPFNLP